MLKILLIITNLILSIKLEKLLSFGYIRYDDLLQITLELGNPHVNVTLPVDLNSMYSWINQNTYNSSLSSSAKEAERTFFFIEGAKLPATYTSDKAVLNETNSFDFNYLSVLYHNTLSRNGTLGFNYHFYDTSLSLIFQMLNQKIISNASFAFAPDCSNIHKGIMYFGGLPDEVVKQNKYKTQIKVSNDFVNWKINIQEAYIKKEKIFVFKNEMLGRMTTMFTNVPLGYFLLLSDHLFRTCYVHVGRKINDWEKKFNTFICKRKEIESGAKLGFVFNQEQIIELEIEKLFECKNKECESLFGHDGTNEWRIGYSLYNNFITEFDYEGFINFYSKEEFLKYPVKKHNFIEYIFLVNIGVTLLGITFCIASKMLFKKRHFLSF